MTWIIYICVTLLIILAYTLGKIQARRKALKDLKELYNDLKIIQDALNEKEIELEMRLEFLKYLERDTF